MGAEDWGFLDDFYLTKGLATESLQERVQKLHARLQDMEEEFTSLLRQCGSVNADLDKIEEKAAFIVQKSEAVEAMFTPPAFEAPDDPTTLAIGKVRAVADMADIALLGVWASSGLTSYVMKRPFKAARKTLGAKSPVVKAMQKSPKFLRAQKLAKLSSKAGAAGLVIMGTMWLLSLKDADALNKALKDNADDIKAKISDLEKDMDELKKELAARRKEIGEVLGEADVTTVGDYVTELAKALDELANTSANALVARRMLIDGLPAAFVERISGLDAKAQDALNTNIRVERALLAGESIAEISARLGVEQTKVISIGAMQNVREALIEGIPIEQLIEETNLSGALLESEQRRVMEDLGPSWDLLSTGGNLTTLQQMMLVSPASLTALSEELQSKAALSAGQPAPFGRAEDHARWREDIARAQSESADGTLPAPDSPEAQHFVVRHRLPLSVLRNEGTPA